jgi:hypothetical protein
MISHTHDGGSIAISPQFLMFHSKLFKNSNKNFTRRDEKYSYKEHLIPPVGSAVIDFMINIQGSEDVQANSHNDLQRSKLSHFNFDAYKLAN